MNTLDWTQLSADARTQALTRPVQTVATQTRKAVATLIADVRARGDVALREITARFDGVTLDSFAVSEAEFAAADAAIAPELRQAMQDAVARIDTFHRAGMSEGYAVETAPAWSAKRSCARSAAWACTCRPAARHCRPPP